ncbi:MAG: T9SS type A sorting domain-containing protein [Bacteroidetes bacterium]|nr:T9SS type A sorting domain-containing protein [Bacteroidota bacterium]
MKKIIIYLFSIIMLLFTIPQSAFAQIDWLKQCGTVQPSAFSVMQPDTIVNGDSVIVIPTVFHILTQGGSENISKSHVLRALQIMNQDFNRQNPDTFDIPAAFHPVRGNPKIEFRLARIDPQGNCTDGIDRIYTPYTATYNNITQVYNFSWPIRQYMNVYVMKWISVQDYPLNLGLTGPVSMDSSLILPDNGDKLMIVYHSLADGFNGVTPSRRKHILSHEMAHAFALAHTWGSGAGCGDDDNVSDTPLQDDQNYACPTFPKISCNNGPNGEMFNNFMDYAECQNMFTEGQSDYMRTCLAINDWRDSLWKPANLAATGVDAILPSCQSAPEADFGYGNFAGWLCAGKPVLFYEAASMNATSYQWEFTGGIPATSTDTFPSVIFPDSGYYTVKLIAGNAFGVDTMVKIIRIEPAEVNYNSAMTESFEDSAFNQQIAPWTFLGKKWSVTNVAAYSGNNSIRLDSSLNHISAFFTHTFDLNQLTGTGRVLEFKEALGLSASGSPINGGLRVIWKRPCAYEFLEMFADTSTGVDAGALNTGNALFPGNLQTVVTNQPFIPIDTTQWQTITLPIPDNLTGEIQIGFTWYNFTPTNKFKGMYIDDIKVMIPVGIAENNAVLNWMLYPNPATNQLTIALPNNRKEVTAIISDITGKIIYKTSATATQKIEVNTSDFAEGIYLVQIQTENFIETKKVIVTK